MQWLPAAGTVRLGGRGRRGPSRSIKLDIVKKEINKNQKVDNEKTALLCFLFPPLGNEVVLTHNKSGRFESRFVSVGIQESPSIWLQGMEGSALGVWVAHGEGRVYSRCVASFTQPITVTDGSS